MTEIELVEISKEYQKGTKAVNCVSFSVLPGEFLVLVGPSGCGKSSLLRMIAGLESITEGELLFNKKLMNNISPEKRNIGMVFQNYALYPHLSVFDNLAFPLKVIKVKKNEIKERVNQIAEMINLTEYLTYKPKELSGGQRQRVALGRALIRKPDVFLFDEPLSNLDAKLRVQMRTEIVNLHSSVKTTSIYVTHDQTEAMTMGDRLVILDKGRIQQIDTPNNLYKNPGNKFVAGFLGSPQMNFMEGILYRDNGIYFRENDSDFTIKLNISDDLKIDANPNYTLGVRPEDIKIPTEINSNSKVFTAIVKNVEYLGFEKIIYFITGGNLKSIRLQANDDIKPGDKFNYSINPTDTYLFDINGERIG